ncbi:MAG: bifunctional folylpolyglutamate synthase/dihydrofolate synthase [Planctomycetales bacterium]|nr:bifunctional folylpolyglutamate synthase/dihydrofolate synthase [Planctomycetales bacterium]
MSSADAKQRRRRAVRQLLDRIDYERGATIPDRSAGLKLDRMHQLLQRLGQPQRGLRAVHVAGTKGKGSTSAMLAAILNAAGHSVGLYTSPHLENLKQRFQINGRSCSDLELAELLETIWPHVEAMDEQCGGPAHGPTYFEITTAAAMLHFRRRQTDLAVLEVGLGGRLDSTNLCLPDLCLITNISFDHTRQLGAKLGHFAREKAGIIKPGVPVISGVRTTEPRNVIGEVAQEHGCRLRELGEHFRIEYLGGAANDGGEPLSRFRYFGGTAGSNQEPRDVSSRMLGRHQAENAALALAAVDELRNQGWSLPDDAVRAGLQSVRCPARIEVCGANPTVVLDAAHNVASVEALVETLDEHFVDPVRWLVFATTQDKDVAGMLDRLLPRFDHILLTRYLKSPRAVPTEQLQQIAQSMTNKPMLTFEDPRDAWKYARAEASPGDLICVTGSFFLAAELRGAIRRDNRARD